MGNTASEVTVTDVPGVMNGDVDGDKQGGSGNSNSNTSITTDPTDTDDRTALTDMSLGEQQQSQRMGDIEEDTTQAQAQAQTNTLPKEMSEGVETVLERNKTPTPTTSEDPGTAPVPESLEVGNKENAEGNTPSFGSNNGNGTRELNEKFGASCNQSGTVGEAEAARQILSTGSATATGDGDSGSIKKDLTMEELCISVEEGEEIDMNYVTEYELAFNEFVFENPQFMIHNPDLLHNLRVFKLQKSLEMAYGAESELTYQLEASQAKKLEMTTSYHQKLREASRNKAAREIHLQQELNTIQQATRVMEGRLTWQMIAKSEARTKKYVQMQQNLALRTIDADDLLSLLPDQPEMQAIREAATAPAGEYLSEEQEKDLRQFQVDNAFLSAEATVLEKKLAYQVAAAKKYAWVDSVFLLMDAKKLKRLKNRYQKKLGVSF
jgi:hypothetical protein